MQSDIVKEAIAEAKKILGIENEGCIVFVDELPEGYRGDPGTLHIEAPQEFGEDHYIEHKLEDWQRSGKQRMPRQK